MIAASVGPGAEPSVLLVGSPWGAPHFPRVNYSVIWAGIRPDGLPGPWRLLPGADPLWRGPAGYSALALAPGRKSFLVAYERGVNNPSEVIRLAEVAFPQ